MSDVELTAAETSAPPQELTFLIADVRGYTRFTREHGDAAAARLASVFAELARDAVEARGGRVIELRGDEALAVFATPAAALRAAAELQAACREEASGRDLPLLVGIGIDAGNAVPVEDGYRGAALNMAARLCSKAAAGEVLVTSNLAGRTGPVAGTSYVSRGTEELKGIDAPVEVVEARTDEPPPLPHRAVPTALPLELEPDTMLAGREHELAWLRGTWRQARRGHGRIVFVSGPPQSGKTRLVAELCAHAAQDGASVVHAGAGGTGTADALTAVDAAATSTTRTVLVFDDLDTIGNVVAERLVAHSDALERSPVLMVGLVRDADCSPALASLIAYADRFGDGHRSLGPLAPHELREIARTYAGADVDDAPLEAIARASGGLPGRVHELMAEWAEQEAARRLAAAAEWLSEGSSRRKADLEFANNVIGLKLARLYGREHDANAAAQAVCPYKGLASFAAEDAQLFFGRERLVGDLAARTVGVGLLAVVGASGSGKSSVIAAGLIPSLAAGLLPGSSRWRIDTMRPGEHPLAELAEIPDGQTAERSVLVVDQFEEIFTTCTDEDERAAFVTALVERAELDPERSLVILSLRGDFVDRCVAYGELAELISANQVLVGPMAQEELRRAIELPARRVGLRVESALTEALVAEIADEPGGLPLLSTALVELWQNRNERWLRMDTHVQTGGVRGAVARLADSTFEQLNEHERTAARSILLRLVAAGEGEGVTRRRASLAEFDVDSDPVAGAVLDRLTEDRLLTRSRSTVEVAHEALLREWPRLQEWLAEDARGRELRGHLAQAARHWEDRGRDAGDVYRGGRLAATLDWAAAHQDELNRLEREFLAAGRAAGERAVRRLRAGIVVLAVLLVAAVVAGALALVQRSQARHSANVALANSLGAQAVSEPRLDLAMLLGRAAVALDSSPRTRTDLLTTLLRAPTVTRTFHLNGNRNSSVLVSPDGRTLAIEDNDGHTVVEDASTGRRLTTFDADIFGFGPDGALLTAQGGTLRGRADTIEVRLPPSFDSKRTIAFPAALRGRHAVTEGAPSFARGDRMAVALIRQQDTPEGPQTTSTAIAQYDYRNGRLAVPPLKEPNDLAFLAYLPGGRRLLLVASQTTTVVDARTGKHITSYSVGGSSDALSPDGTTVGLGGADGSVRFLSLAAGRVTLGIGAQAGGAVPMGFTPDGKTLITSGDDGKTLLWDVQSHTVRNTLAGHAGPIHAQAISADGSSLYTGSFDSNVLGWDLTGKRGLVPSFIAAQTDPAAATWSLAISPDSRTIAVGSTNGTVNLWNVTTLRKVQSFRALPASVAALAFSPRGDALMVAGDTRSPPRAWLRIWTLGPHPRLLRSMQGLAQFHLITWATWSPDGRTLAASGFLTSQDYNHAGVAAEWDARTGRLLAAPTVVPGGYPTDIAFAPDGKTVAVGEYNGGIEILDPAKREMLRRFSHGGLYTFGVAFSPDGSKLASGDWDGSLDIWDAKTGKLVGSPIPDPDQGVVNSVAWSPDGRTIAITDWQPTLRLFDVASRREIGPAFQLGAGQPNPYVAFTPDGTRAVVTDDTGRTWLFPVSMRAWESAACRIAARNFTRAEWTEVGGGRPYRPFCPSPSQ